MGFSDLLSGFERLHTNSRQFLNEVIFFLLQSNKNMMSMDACARACVGNWHFGALLWCHLSSAADWIQLLDRFTAACLFITRTSASHTHKVHTHRAFCGRTSSLWLLQNTPPFSHKIYNGLSELLSINTWFFSNSLSLFRALKPYRLCSSISTRAQWPDRI